MKVLEQQLEPRKTPRQARSAASVEAILEATVQVLLKEGKSRLTTTRVAERAGVSVGTLYQYFPNKSSLLQALLTKHLDSVAEAVEDACETARGTTPAVMAVVITKAFVKAKFRHADASSVMYEVSEDVGGRKIAWNMHARAIRAMTTLFATAKGGTIQEPGRVAEALLSAMAGVSRTMLEKGARRDTIAGLEEELTRMVTAYLEASATGSL